MLCNIQPSTLTYFLWKRGRFKSPMLWNAVEVIKRLPAVYRSNVYVKGFNRAVPIPLALPQNCSKCNTQVADKLIHWNLTGDYNHIKNLPKCNCYKIFEQKMNEPPALDLKERVKQIKKYIQDEIGKS